MTFFVVQDRFSVSNDKRFSLPQLFCHSKVPIISCKSLKFNLGEVFGRAIASKFRGGARIEAKNGRREDGRKRCARPGNDFCSGSGSTDRTNQTASLARYHHHCELRGDLRSRWMGRHRGIWESEGGLAHRVAAAAQRDSFA